MTSLTLIGALTACGGNNDDPPPAQGDSLTCGAGTMEVDGACVVADDANNMTTPTNNTTPNNTSSPSLVCGEGTVEKEGVCLPAEDPMEEEREWRIDVDEEWATENARKPRVDTFHVVDAQVYEPEGRSYYVGYPVIVDVNVDVRGEPFQADLYVGLESKDGTKGCVIGRAELTHQPDAFEAAEKAQQAALFASMDVPPSSYDDCGESRACSADGEVCTRYEVGEATGEGENSELVLEEVWSCIQREALTTAEDNSKPIDPRDFGERSQGFIQAEFEQLIPKTCDVLVGESDVNVWLSFDPFQNTIYKERAEVETPSEASDGAVLEFVRQQRAAFSSCGAQEMPAVPGCSTRRELLATPGVDFRMRELKLSTAVFMPVSAQESDAGQADLDVSTEVSTYGVQPEDAEDFEDAIVDVVFSVRPVESSANFPQNMMPGANDLDWVDLNVIKQEVVRAGEDPTLEELEQWLLSLLEPVTVTGTQYEIGFKDAHRASLLTGTLSYYDQFELRVCAEPDFTEASGMDNNNCQVRTILKTDDLGNAPAADVGGGSSLCTDQLIGQYGSLKAEADAAVEAARLRNWYYVSDASWKSFREHHYLNWPDGFVHPNRDLDSEWVWATLQWKDLTSEQRHERLTGWWKFNCYDQMHAGVTEDNIYWGCKYFFGKIAQRYVIGEDGNIKDIEDDGAWFDQIYYYKESAKNKQDAAAALFKNLAVQCQDAERGFEDNEAQVVGQLFALGKSGGTPSINGLRLGYSLDFQNDILKQRYAQDFKIIAGPRAKIFLDGTGIVDSWDIHNVLAAYARVHAHSVGAGSWFEMNLEALTATLFHLEFNLPDSWELVDPPSFSKEVARCKTFQAGPIPVEVCGSLGGELSIDVGLTLEGKDATGKLEGTVNPYVRTTASASVAVSLLFISGGVRLDLDPLAYIGFPVTATLEWMLTLNEPARQINYTITPSISIKNERELFTGSIVAFLGSVFEGTIYEWNGLTKEDVLFEYTASPITGSKGYIQ